MLVGHPDRGGVTAALDGDGDIQHQVGVGREDLDGGRLQIVAQGFSLLWGDGGDDLQLPVGVASHYAHSGGSLDALPTTGVGDYHALYVLDDIAAGRHGNGFGKRAQQLPGLGGAEGDGDGLGTAHGGHQLLGQDAEIGRITGIVLIHGKVPPTQCLQSKLF